MNAPKYHDQLPAYLRWLADQTENLALDRRGDDAEVRRLGGKAHGLRLAAAVAESLLVRPPVSL